MCLASDDEKGDIRKQMVELKVCETIMQVQSGKGGDKDMKIYIERIKKCL